MRGVEKDKYISGEEAGEDSHDGSVRDPCSALSIQFNVSNRGFNFIQHPEMLHK